MHSVSWQLRGGQISFDVEIRISGTVSEPQAVRKLANNAAAEGKSRWLYDFDQDGFAHMIEQAEAEERGLVLTMASVEGKASATGCHGGCKWVKRSVFSCMAAGDPRSRRRKEGLVDWRLCFRSSTRWCRQGVSEASSWLPVSGSPIRRRAGLRRQRPILDGHQKKIHFNC